jgi:hypothetical protein
MLSENGGTTYNNNQIGINGLHFRRYTRILIPHEVLSIYNR